MSSVAWAAQDNTELRWVAGMSGMSLVGRGMDLTGGAGIAEAMGMESAAANGRRILQKLDGEAQSRVPQVS